MNWPLEIGSRGALHIRREVFRRSEDATPYKIFYASDLHLKSGHSMAVVDQLLSAVKETKPDIILLGGDMVDGAFGVNPLAKFVSSASALAPVWAIRGNHDRLVSADRLDGSLTSSGGHWLEGQTLNIQKGRIKIKIAGDLKQGPLLMEARDFPVLCAHNPVVFPRAAALYYSLVLAGHLHGCQGVFWQKDERLFPGAWFYKWNGLRFHEGRTTLLVSRGVSDTLPIRWNCPREVLLCEIY